MQEAIYTLIDRLLSDIRHVDWVSMRETWIITEEQGKTPRLEKARILSFWDTGMGYENGRVDVVTMMPETEEILIKYAQERLGLKRFSPGSDDAKSLIGVWA